MRKYSILAILGLFYVNQPLFAEAFPETMSGDTRQVRSINSPDWLQAVGRSNSVTSDATRESCSWSLIVDAPGKDGVIVAGAGHCVDHWYEGGNNLEVGENEITWTTQSGQKITRQIVEIFEASMSSGDYAIAKLDHPISRQDIEPLMSSPYHYSDMLDVELFASNGEPFKPFATMAGYSADTGLGQKGKVLTYDVCRQVNGGKPGNKKAFCWSYPGASGGPLAVTLYLKGDFSGDTGGLWLFEDYIPNVIPGTYTFWAGTIVGGEGRDGYDKTMFTETSHYSEELDKILAAH